MEFACEAAIYDSKRNIYVEFEFLDLGAYQNYSAMNCDRPFRRRDKIHATHIALDLYGVSAGMLEAALGH